MNMRQYTKYDTKNHNKYRSCTYENMKLNTVYNRVKSNGAPVRI